MRIEFQITWPWQTYYEFAGIRERIRFDGRFYWIFNGRTYRTCASNFPKIYLDDPFHGQEVIASRSREYGKESGRSWWNPLMKWNIVDNTGRNWSILETSRRGGWFVNWKSTDGKRIMTFGRKNCWKGTAVIRSDWSENVGMLVGLIVPWVLSSG